MTASSSVVSESSVRCGRDKAGAVRGGAYGAERAQIANPSSLQGRRWDAPTPHFGAPTLGAGASKRLVKEKNSRIRRPTLSAHALPIIEQKN